MKKTLLFFILSILINNVNFAQSNLEVSAQIRPRFQMSDKDFNSDISSNNFTELRTRLGLKFSPIDNVVGFVQLQDSRIFGTEPSTLDAIDNIDLHQAYFSVNKLFDLPMNITLGRMELSYGPQRLIGAVGWHNVGRSFNGGVLQLNTEKVTIDFFASKTAENNNPGDSLDFNLFGLYADLKLAEKYKIQPFVIGESIAKTDFARFTLGLYINGNLGNLSHEIEAAYQLGSASTNVDIAAYMFALNLNYQFSGELKPAIGVGLDFLSGDDREDTDKYKVFNTLYATNHKYYGYMDYFINIPNHTLGLGLMDMHIKCEISPIEKLKAQLAYHIFNSNAAFTLTNGNTSKNFGSELDLTLIYNYNKAINFTGGFSFFAPGDIFKQTKGKDTSIWSYLMATVNL